MQNKSLKHKVEHGDFQTPEKTSQLICTLLKELGYRPRSFIEPTCGIGNFVTSVIKVFSSNIQKGLAVDFFDGRTADRLP